MFVEACGVINLVRGMEREEEAGMGYLALHEAEWSVLGLFGVESLSRGGRITCLPFGEMGIKHL